MMLFSAHKAWVSSFFLLLSFLFLHSQRLARQVLISADIEFLSLRQPVFGQRQPASSSTVISLDRQPHTASLVIDTDTEVTDWIASLFRLQQAIRDYFLSIEVSASFLYFWPLPHTESFLIITTGHILFTIASRIHWLPLYQGRYSFRHCIFYNIISSHRDYQLQPEYHFFWVIRVSSYHFTLTAFIFLSSLSFSSDSE